MNVRSRYLAYHVQGAILSLPVFSVVVFLEQYTRFKYSWLIGLIVTILYLSFAFFEKPKFLLSLTVQPLSLSSSKKIFAAVGVLTSMIFFDIIVEDYTILVLASALLFVSLLLWAYFDE